MIPERESTSSLNLAAMPCRRCKRKPASPYSSPAYGTGPPETHKSRPTLEKECNVSPIAAFSDLDKIILTKEMHQEPIEKIIFLNSPLSKDDLIGIESILRSTEIFCAFPDELDPYSLTMLQEQSVLHETSIKALLDRNVLNDILDLIRNPEQEISERGRIGAAIMAFLQACNALIEPNFALYEHPESGSQNLVLFRRADNIDIQIYAEIALGRLTKMPLEAIPPEQPEPSVDYYVKPKGWRAFYIICLKLACLELNGDFPLEKAKAFLHWLISDYFVTPSAVILAGTFFTPRRAKPMIRDLKTADREKVLKNIKNAAWDLILISQWCKLVSRQSGSNSLWLLCSRDKALKKIANVIHSGDHKDVTGKAANIEFFKSEWGEVEGAALADLANNLEELSKSPDRRITTATSEYHDNLQSRLEADILGWPHSINR